MEISTKRLLDALIGSKDYATLEEGDEVLVQLRLVPFEKRIFALVPITKSKLVKVYHRAIWMQASERQDAIREKCRVIRQRSLVRKESLAKARQNLIILTNGGLSEDNLQQMLDSLLSQPSQAATLGQMLKLSEEETSALFDSNINESYQETFEMEER